MQNTAKLSFRTVSVTAIIIACFLVGYALVPIVCETYNCVTGMLQNYLLEVVRESNNFYAAQY